jgi:stalled ribosome alternative rescue factor ArfA
MTNTAARLVVDPLFRRGLLFFSGGIKENVLRNLFSSKNFFRKQIKTGKNSEG